MFRVEFSKALKLSIPGNERRDGTPELHKGRLPKAAFLRCFGGPGVLAVTPRPAPQVSVQNESKALCCQLGFRWQLALATKQMLADARSVRVANLARVRVEPWPWPLSSASAGSAQTPAARRSKRGDRASTAQLGACRSSAPMMEHPTVLLAFPTSGLSRGTKESEAEAARRS